MGSRKRHPTAAGPGDGVSSWEGMLPALSHTPITSGLLLSDVGEDVISLPMFKSYWSANLIHRMRREAVGFGVSNGLNLSTFALSRTQDISIKHEPYWHTG